MRKAIEIIKDFKEIQAEVSRMNDNQRITVREQAIERGRSICAKCLLHVFEESPSIDPGILCQDLPEFPEAVAWGMLFRDDALDNLAGWPPIFFAEPLPASVAYSEEMWKSVEEIGSLLEDQHILPSIYHAIKNEELNSYFVCIASGFWFEIDPQEMASVWLNLCIYTTEQLNSGNYPAGSNAYARELLMQRYYP